MSLANIVRLNKKGYTALAVLILIYLYLQFGTNNDRRNEEIALPDLLQVSIQAAEAGGKLVFSTRNHLNVHSKGKTKEGMEDSVTTADLLSHCAMKGIIQNSFPTVAFISEETKVPCESSEIVNTERDLGYVDVRWDPVKATDVTVWIDPLDATHEYTEKLYEYVTTMVCVAIKGKPIIGVIHSPFNSETYWAVVGNAVSPNLKNKKIGNKDVEQVKVIVSRSHSGTIKEVLKKRCDKCEVIIAAGAGYKALKVAEGSVQAYLHNTEIKKWDICAGNAIINALGGQMTTKNGNLLSYSNDSDIVNTEGLIATLKNHEYFIDKLKLNN